MACVKPSEAQASHVQSSCLGGQHPFDSAGKIRIAPTEFAQAIRIPFGKRPSISKGSDQNASQAKVRNLVDQLECLPPKLFDLTSRGSPGTPSPP